jgi:hypothetical protein
MHHVDRYFGKIMEDEMGKVCSTHEGLRNYCKIVVGKTRTKMKMEDFGVGEDVDWIRLAQNRVQWLARVSTVLNL